LPHAKQEKTKEVLGGFWVFDMTVLGGKLLSKFGKLSLFLGSGEI